MVLKKSISNNIVRIKKIFQVRMVLYIPKNLSNKERIIDHHKLIKALRLLSSAGESGKEWFCVKCFFQIFKKKEL